MSAAVERVPTHADRFRDVLSRIAYKGWVFNLGGDNGRHWLQVEFYVSALDAQGHAEPGVQKGRKWLLSEHMTESEIVQTAFKAVLSAEEHETREQFLVEGVPVLGPHFDLFALAALSSCGLLPLSERAR